MVWPELWSKLAEARAETYNPVTYIVEGVRAVILSGWSGPAIWQGFGVATVLCVVMLSPALASFQKSLK